MSTAVSRACVEVKVFHGPISAAFAGEGAAVKIARSSAGGQGAAQIAAARYLDCETHEVDLALRERGDSVSGKPTLYDATRRCAAL